ncbi:MAG TPA: polysaccharide biosynthesis C-terminal domain-containing protein [Flavobacteriales bacterium]|nr:oligosaccharide flippase family protein [Flavobacteriales bacterium]MBK7102743.1 oligosaccharide flippase family protein [Flavobacteriales bacterium]MBK7113651.1 oligosaccharide flippase family protein [Flavobacteriales bacterium]MBK8531013.1 oligosaccharide flippase family protein [Flavobacteriales bacterium]MBP9159677.1 oligosaccharide flippase family protein [Flavobacteriales bacterium]
MSTLRNLAGQTAIYGLSSIGARFLNYLLVPLHTSKGVFEPAEFGVITSLYAWTAFLNVVLTFGMETTFFRFTNKDNAALAEGEKGSVFTTASYALLFSSLAFMVLGTGFSGSIANGIGFPAHSVSVLMLVLIIGIDALTTIPMARLRQQGRAWRFAAINILSVVVNVAGNLFIFLYCMKKFDAGESNALIDAVYDPSFGVGYVFLINLISTGVKLVMLLPEWPPFRAFSKPLLRTMLAFGAPLMVAGLAGMVNETADRIILKYLLPEGIADAQIGIYGACYKLAVLITLFIQAFRMGAEPFFFSHAKEKNSGETFARIMNIFVAVCMSAFLVVMLFLDLFKWFIPNPAYHEGLRVVPILMLANVFLGIYYNQSVWYKLTDRTRVGGTIAIIGAAITIAFNFALIPVLGYMGSAWATLACYAGMAVISYAWGQKHYPIPYNVSRVLLYMAGGVMLWWGADQVHFDEVIGYGIRAGAMVGFLLVAWKLERHSFSNIAQ